MPSKPLPQKQLWEKTTISGNHALGMQLPLQLNPRKLNGESFSDTLHAKVELVTRTILVLRPGSEDKTRMILATIEYKQLILFSSCSPVMSAHESSSGQLPAQKSSGKLLPLSWCSQQCGARQFFSRLTSSCSSLSRHESA